MLNFLKKHWLSLVFLVLVGLAVTWVVRKYRVPGSMTVLQSQVMDMKMRPPPGTTPVATVQLKRGPFQASLSCTGSVEAWADEDVVARVAGTVLRILVYPGQRVKAGELLAQLDSAELTARTQEAEAGVRERRLQAEMAGASLQKSGFEVAALGQDLGMAQARLKEAHIEVDVAFNEWQVQKDESARSDRLYAEGGVSLEEQQAAWVKQERARAEWHHRQQRTEEVRLQVQQVGVKSAGLRAAQDKSRFELEAARAGRDKASAQADTARIGLGYTEIRAQQAGEVTERLVSPGTLVLPGRVLLKLKTAGELRLQARVPAAYLGKVHPGGIMQARLQDGSAAFSVPVSAVFQEVDMATRTFTVEGRLAPHTSPRALVSGEYLELTVPLGRPRNLVSLPLEGIHTDLDGTTFVWRVKSQGTAENPASYTCVMHPQIHKSQPGDCPICGMKLVPEQSSAGLQAEKITVKIVAEAGQRVAVESGLEQDDEVVVAGGEHLQEGSALARVQWGPEGPAHLPAPKAPAPGNSAMPDMPGMPGMK